MAFTFKCVRKVGVMPIRIQFDVMTYGCYHREIIIFISFSFCFFLRGLNRNGVLVKIRAHFASGKLY